MLSIMALLCACSLLLLFVCGAPIRAVSSLRRPAIVRLPLGAVLPSGWLATQLQTQTNGLAGHLALFYGDVLHSTWLGGNATEGGGLHERLPYWLNGAVPAAFLLEEPVGGKSLCASPLQFTRPGKGAHAAIHASERVSGLRSQVTSILEHILSNQSTSGWLGGPDNDNDTPTNGDQYWITFGVVNALLTYAEAVPAVAQRVQSALLLFVAETARRMTTAPPTGWSAMRWPEYGTLLQRMLDTFTALTENEAALLLDAAHIAQSTGFNWTAYFFNASMLPSFNASTLPFAAVWTLTEHGVNHAHGLKASAVAWRLGGGDEQIRITHAKVEMLFGAHGQPTGTYSADECLGGQEPDRGVELCTIVETAHSLALLHRTFGDVKFSDRVERIIYNALPGGISEDGWSHNYLSQSNQIFAGCCVWSHPWQTDGPDAIMYGLEPNFGCCTANLGQGWPKFISYMMGVAHNGSVVFSFYGPASATVGSASFVVTTEYPFSDEVLISVSSGAPLHLSLRIPGWAVSASVSLNGGKALSASPGSFFSLAVPGGQSSVAISFQFDIVITPGWGSTGGVSVSRGPLVFALPLMEQWTPQRSYAFQSKDWEVTTASPWNYALVLSNLKTPHKMQLHRSVAPPGANNASPAFTAAAPRVWLTGSARRLASWASPDGLTAPPPPLSPVCGGNVSDCGPLEQIVLVPYGNTRLRISVLPFAFV